ncbi:MAG: phage Gp37/Gp68 family protein [Candidatus Omnitrophica bacterium]|nr:phage Gp37/Gp68 family protein [Candidatus Omnitrophota bacterium]
MSFPTKIEYADGTFSPWYGCTKVSPGCEHCFAERWARRTGMVEWGPGSPRRLASEAAWRAPLRWNRDVAAERKRYRVLVDLCDPFDSEVDPLWSCRFHDLIEKTPSLDWLLLTKRIATLQGLQATKNVKLGITVCNQHEADRDIPILLQTQAYFRWVSIEPMLGPIDLSNYLNEGDRPGLDWVVCGGETGPGARPMHPDCPRRLRDQCFATGTAFFFKQWGEFRPVTPLYDGRDDEAENGCGELYQVDRNGHVWEGFEGQPIDSRTWLMERVGRKAAGHLLDGEEWRELP